MAAKMALVYAPVMALLRRWRSTGTACGAERAEADVAGAEVGAARRRGLDPPSRALRSRQRRGTRMVLAPRVRTRTRAPWMALERRGWSSGTRVAVGGAAG